MSHEQPDMREAQEVGRQNAEALYGWAWKILYEGIYDYEDRIRAENSLTTAARLTKDPDLLRAIERLRADIVSRYGPRRSA